MSKIICSDRHFSVFSDLRSNVRCFIAYDGFAKGISERELMDLISESDNLSALAWFNKKFFMVDTQIFTDCIIFEVAFKGVSTTLDIFTIETIAAAEMVHICDVLHEKYEVKSE